MDHDSCENSVKQNSFYVDDYLQSVVSIDSGVKLVYSIKRVLNDNGFQLTKFVANDPALLCNIPTPDICYEKDNVLIPLTDSKIIVSIMWNVSDDYFYFDVNIKKSDVFTRRHILSFISSIFDPLGLISPILVPSKCIFKKTTMLKWDIQFLMIHVFYGRIG